MTKAKVTIVSLTYNQEKYVAQTLDSFLMQKTNFPFEIVIADDASTDNTPKIIKEYAEKHPDVITPILRDKNLGAEENYFDALSRVKSEYLIYCDGDDYFTDPLKIQKQVDFLDANHDYAICFHPVKVFFEENDMPAYLFPNNIDRFDPNRLYIEELLTWNFMQTNSVMYRWRFNKAENVRDVFPKEILPGDWFLHLLHAQTGKIGFLEEVMADYRRHRGGVWWQEQTIEDSIRFHLQYGVKEVKFYVSLCNTFPEYNRIGGQAFVTNYARTIFRNYLNVEDFEKMKAVMDLCPDILKPDVVNKVSP